MKAARQLRSAWVIFALVLLTLSAVSRTRGQECVQPQAEGCPVEAGDTVTAVLVDQDIWLVQVTSPGVLNVVLTDLDVDYDLHLRTPDGNIFHSENEENNDDVITIANAVPGTYLIVVNSGRGDLSETPYSLVTDFTPSGEVFAGDLGGPVTAPDGTPGPISDIIGEITGRTPLPTPTPEPTPEPTAVSEADAGDVPTATATRVVVLAAANKPTINPPPAPTNTRTPTGTVRPSATTIGCPSGTTQMSVGSTVNGTLNAGDIRSKVRFWAYAELWCFSAIAGQQLVIAMDSPFDAYLYLYFRDRSGGAVDFNDDGGDGLNARIPATTGCTTLPSRGVYVIEATSFGVNSTGPYSLTVTSTCAAQSGD